MKSHTILPKYNGLGAGFELLQEGWKKTLDPIIQEPPLSGVFIQNQVLKSGVNVINTLLGRVQQGWIITDINAAVSVYRSQPFNDLTLTLTSSGPATISLWVY